MSDPAHPELRLFFSRYGAAFEAFDAPLIADHYTLPALFVREGVPETVATAEALAESVEGLLALHRAWDVETARVASLAELERAPDHRVVRVGWRLGRRASRLAWAYATTYVLVPDRRDGAPRLWRLAAALTHDAPF